MSIFKKPDVQPHKPRDRTGLPGRGGVAEGAISIIGPGMVIDGDIVTEGIVRIEGELRGTVRAAKAVIVGQSGRVEGHVLTEDAVIGGSVNGSIVARNRLELQSTCTVEGEIHARAEHFKLEEGARFAGQIDMVDDEAAPPAPISGTGEHTDIASLLDRRTSERADLDEYEEDSDRELSQLAGGARQR